MCSYSLLHGVCDEQCWHCRSFEPMDTLCSTSFLVTLPLHLWWPVPRAASQSSSIGHVHGEARIAEICPMSCCYHLSIKIFLLPLPLLVVYTENVYTFHAHANSGKCCGTSFWSCGQDMELVGIAVAWQAASQEWCGRIGVRQAGKKLYMMKLQQVFSVQGWFSPWLSFARARTQALCCSKLVRGAAGLGLVGQRPTSRIVVG